MVEFVDKYFESKWYFHSMREGERPLPLHMIDVMISEKLTNYADSGAYADNNARMGFYIQLPIIMIPLSKDK